MGTVFTIDVRDALFDDPGVWHRAIGEAVRFLHRTDGIFSTYRPGSDISRICRGELCVDDADPDVGEVLDRCVAMQRATDGYFSPLWSGRLDPTGLVKGWATEKVSELLRRHGSRHHAVNGGGDVQLAGEAAPGRPWRVGITDPLRPGETILAVEGRDFAVATSGTAERGAHIRDPFTNQVVTTLASVTVVGRSLTVADCFATAAFAMGENAAAWLEAQPGYEGVVVHPDGSRQTTTSARLARAVGD
jgi:thiamine biosynthesis lipoprotein